MKKNSLLEVNNYVNKIDKLIANFKFNVCVAQFYEIYKILKDYAEAKIGNKVLKENAIKIMKLMTPFAPHLAYECLELLGCKTVNNWPIIDKNNMLDEIQFAVQINGKTRDVIKAKKDMHEKEINQIIKKDSKAKKYIEDKKIIKTIFIKNKIINFIVSDK